VPPFYSSQLPQTMLLMRSLSGDKFTTERSIEIAGPEQFRFDELIRQRLSGLNDSPEVIADPHARYFGAEMSEDSLVPVGEAQLGETRFEDWLNSSTSQTAKKASQVV